MQGAEIKDEGSVRKDMTKSEIDEQRSSLHIMTQRYVRRLKRMGVYILRNLQFVLRLRGSEVHAVHTVR